MDAGAANLVDRRIGWRLPPISPVGVGLIPHGAGPFFYFLLTRDRPEGTLLVPSVANLKSARPLSLDHSFAVQRAQFDLTNVTARAVNLLGDQGRAL